MLVTYGGNMSEQDSRDAKLFLLETPSVVGRLREAIRLLNQAETERQANNLKTIAMRVGAAQIRDEAWRIELVAREGDLKYARTLFGRLRGDLARVSDELAEHLSLEAGSGSR